MGNVTKGQAHMAGISSDHRRLELYHECRQALETAQHDHPTTFSLDAALDALERLDAGVVEAWLDYLNTLRGLPDLIIEEADLTAEEATRFKRSRRRRSSNQRSAAIPFTMPPDF